MDFSSFFNYANPEKVPEQEAFLSVFTEHDWEQFLPYTRTHLFNTNEVVINYQDEDRSLFILIEGHVDVLVPTHGFHKTKKIMTISEGSVFGELSFLDAVPRSALVQATCPGRVLIFTFEAFERMRSEHPHLSEIFIFELARILARRLRNTTQVLGINL